MKPDVSQKRISMTIGPSLLSAVDAARGTMSRSEFIRECLAEKLILDESFVAAPDRVGKGGAPTHKKNRRIPELKDEVTEVPDQMVAEDSYFNGKLLSLRNSD